MSEIVGGAGSASNPVVAGSGVGVLDKAMMLLALLEAGPATLAELVAQSSINRATAHRLLSALEAHGMVSRPGLGQYQLGHRLVTLARQVGSRPLAELAQPVLEHLRSVTGESAQLYVLDGIERVCVAAAESPHGLRTIVPVGERLTMGKGSAARVLAGEGEPGLAVASVAERQAGVASVSAAVLDGGRRIVAAVSVSGPIERLGTDPASLHGRHVVAAAEALAAELAVGGNAWAGVKPSSRRR